MKNQAPRAMERPRKKILLIKLWHHFAINNLLVVYLFEYIKLVQMAIVQIIGNIKNERTFSTLTFMKSKLWNCLVGHLNIVIHMFVQKNFIKDTFPFQVAIANWNDGDKVIVGVNA
jgi:hypothetical protein